VITLAINNFHFKLDIEREDYIPKFGLKQYDTAIFYASIYKNGLPYHFENEQIKMFVKKQDGTIVYQEDNISIQDDEVKINVKNQALVCSGLTYAELELKSSDGQVTSSTFVYEVKEKVGSDKAIESVTDIATLDKLKKYMEDAKKELERFKIELSKIEDLVANKDKLESQNEDAKKNIVELGKVLEDANNITSDEGKFITGNNVVSESTNGYIQGLKIYGRSLVNICNNDLVNSNKGLYYNTLNLGLLPLNIPLSLKIFTGNLDNKYLSWAIYGVKSDSSVVPIYPYTYNFDKAIIKIQPGYSSYRLYLRNHDGNNYIDFDRNQIKINLIVGDENAGLHFEGLSSSGNGNEIEVSSVNDGNLFDGKFEKSSVNGATGEMNAPATVANVTTVNLIPIIPSLPIKYISTGNRTFRGGANTWLYWFDKDKKYIDKATLTTFEPIKAPPNCRYVRISFTDYELSNAYGKENYNITISQIGTLENHNFVKQDKKTILFKDTDSKWKPITNLPGCWEDGKFVWGDTIELHSDGKYYLHVRTKTSKGTDLIGLVKEQNFPNRDGYYGFLPNKEGIKLPVPDKTKPYIICDNLKTVGTDIISGSQYSDVDCISYDTRYQCIRLSVPKGTNINTYLAEKNITFILPIDEKVYECLDISPRAFRNKTMLSIDSEAIDPGVSYYIPTGFLSADNSISSKVETLDKYSEKNIKDIEDLTSNIENNYFNINRGLLTDFNNGIQEGKYYLHSTSLIPNSPPTSQTSLYGIVQVFYKNYNELFQLVALHNSELWIRFRNGQDKWNPWNKILNSQDFETQHGSNGFLKFPNGSVLLFGSGVTNNGVLRINFKLTFAKSDDIVLTGSALDPSPQTVGFRNLTTTGCELTCSWASNPVGVKWFAFGKIQ
jgi:hypothetical protein